MPVAVVKSTHTHPHKRAPDASAASSPSLLTLTRAASSFPVRTHLDIGAEARPLALAPAERPAVGHARRAGAAHARRRRAPQRLPLLRPALLRLALRRRRARHAARGSVGPRAPDGSARATVTRRSGEAFPLLLTHDVSSPTSLGSIARWTLGDFLLGDGRGQALLLLLIMPVLVAAGTVRKNARCPPALSRPPPDDEGRASARQPTGGARHRREHGRR